MNQRDALLEVCNRMLKWHVMSHLGASDILVDPATDTIAFWGQALKLERGALKYGLNNRGYHLNVSFGQLFDIPVEVEHWPKSYQVRQTKPFWFHDEGQDGQGAAVSQFLEELRYAIKSAMIALGSESFDHELNVTIIPEPGFPFTPGKTTEIYSAKKKKLVKVSQPPWVIKVKDRENQDRWGVDFCQLMPLICSPSKALVGVFQSRDMQFLVTHCLPLGSGGKMRDELKKQLAHCDGMLFPSLATGLIPSTNFGDTVLVTRPDIPLLAMKPYKERGQYPVLSYNTDVWTETTGGFLGEISIAAFEQLCGHDNYMYGEGHLWILGPSMKTEGFGDEEVTPILATKKLASAMQKKFKIWRRDLTQEKFAALSDLMTGERYGYLETKVNGVLSWDCFPLAVCPASVAKTVSKSLKEMGFTGVLITVETSPEMDIIASGKSSMRSEDQDFIQYQYAWQCRDAILAYAAKEMERSNSSQPFFNVMEG